MVRPFEIPVSKINARCDLTLLHFDSTDELQPLDTIIGQDRAIRSLEFGLGLWDSRFNIFAAGPQGTGKTKAIKRFVDKYSASRTVPADVCYVFNFSDPSRPTALMLSNIMGQHFQHDMASVVVELKENTDRAFSSEEYAKMREQLINSSVREKEQKLKDLYDTARQKNFLLQSTPTGLSLAAVNDNQEPLSSDQYIQLNADQKQDIEASRGYLDGLLKDTLSAIRANDKAVSDRLSVMDGDIVQNIIDIVLYEIREKYRSHKQVSDYLDDVCRDIILHKELFMGHRPDSHEQSSGSDNRDNDDFMKRYEVNLLIDNSDLEGAPVIHEIDPTFNNLFGVLEAETQYGSLRTDFTMIRPGSLHRANGGYLIINAEDLLRDQTCWEGLKRCVREKSIVVDDILDYKGYVATKRLRPLPIPLDVKIILIGASATYHVLYNRDDDFVELFKVKADFDSSMDRTVENIENYASFISTLCFEDSLLHLDRSAVGRIIEYSARLAGHQNKLSTKFAEISDVIREASYWAGESNSAITTSKHIDQAIKERTYRSDLIQDKIMEMIENGVVDISTQGDIIGQVNGLAVIGIGDFSFGKPGRITVSISAGRDGLVDVERESDLGGRLHTKGVMILNGYLADRFAQSIPLTMSARITFEQSYDEVDGDSASSTELYAILSKLSGIPLNQGLAVTGSVNQFGEIQAIGGVNEKIEGFFRVCKAQGLDGRQGVLIPATNVGNLMLDDEVVQAVKTDEFHIYAVPDIASGMEILTGIQYGQKNDDGSFPDGSISDKVQSRLIQLANDTRDFMKANI